jgi:hypothetical protein
MRRYMGRISIAFEDFFEMRRSIWRVRQPSAESGTDICGNGEPCKNSQGLIQAQARTPNVFSSASHSANGRMPSEAPAPHRHEAATQTPW